MQNTKERLKTRCGLAQFVALLSFLMLFAFGGIRAQAQTSIPLTVSFYYPTNGQTYAAPATVVVHALVLDSVVVKTVQYFANGTSIGTCTNTNNVVLTNSNTGNPFALGWSNVMAGTYALTAVATDASKVVVTSAPVSITVLPPPPPIPLSVSFYYPTNGQTYTAPAHVVIRPLVLDSVVVKTVQYFANGTSIGTLTNSNNIILTNSSTSSPFVLTWSNVMAGAYTLSAVATDASNVVVTSAPVNISVLPPSPPPPPIPLSVSFYYPTNGQTYTAPANIVVHALVLDSVVVQTVQYFANGTNIGTVTNVNNIILTNSSTGNPFALVWSNVMAGNYSLTAVATDASNVVVTSAPVSITVLAPPPPPPPIPLTVSFYYPTNGQTYRAPANIVVHALVLDSVLVETVQYFANGTNIGTVTNSNKVVLTNSSTGNPFGLTWSNVMAGAYALTAVATDASNVVVTSAPVNITVLPPPPPIPLMVSFYYPTNGQTYTAPANVVVHALVLDSVVVQTVQYFANGTSIGTRTNTNNIVLTNSTTPNPFVLTWSNVVAGNYSLTAVATDASGTIVTSAPVSISVVAPTPPPPPPVPLTVSFYYPTNGQTYTAPANIIMHAQVLDSNVVQTVQYFANGTSIGTRTNTNNIVLTNANTSNPFVLTWSNVVAGTYSLTAVATDSAGTIVTSAPVSVSVVAPPTPPPVPLTVSFLYPTNGQTYIAPTNIAVHALVLDSVVVYTVQYFANGLSIGTRTNSSKTAFTNSSTPNPFVLIWSNVMAGSYALTAVATDVSGTVVTSAPVSITVRSPSAPPPTKASLTLVTIGNGRITGQTNHANLELNKNYTVGEAPGPNWLFVNWMVGTNSTSLNTYTNAPYLSFVMVSNLIVEATFVTNPFTAVAGVYNGLFYPTTGPTEESSGFITVTVPTSSHGAFSAKLLLDGGSCSFSGTFDLAGFAQKTITRTGKAAITVDLQINLAGSGDQITGAVTDSDANGWVSSLQADRIYFNSQTAPATGLAGKFTLVVPPGTEAPTNDPGGFGYATLLINLAGRAYLSGQLADGAYISQSVPVSRHGDIPVYVPLYYGQGSLIGWLSVAINGSMNPPQTIEGTNLAWFKIIGKPGTLYASGFAETNITVLGSPYAPPPSGGNVLTLTNGTLTIQNAAGGGSLVYSNLAVVGYKLVNQNTNGNPTNHLVGYFSPGSGIVTLSFRQTGAHSDTIARGVVLQDTPPADAAGWFPATNYESGSFLLSQ